MIKTKSTHAHKHAHKHAHTNAGGPKYNNFHNFFFSYPPPSPTHPPCASPARLLIDKKIKHFKKVCPFSLHNQAERAHRAYVFVEVRPCPQNCFFQPNAAKIAKINQLSELSIFRKNRAFCKIVSVESLRHRRFRHRA